MGFLEIAIIILVVTLLVLLFFTLKKLLRSNISGTSKILWMISFVFFQIVGVVVFPVPSIAQHDGMVRDTEGNIYKTIKIGDKEWFAENLRTTKFSDGKAIPFAADKSEWNILSSPAYCWYNNDSSYRKTYGALYNGFAVNTGKLCPDGWHISSDEEWNYIVEKAGGETVAGKALKDNSAEKWKTPGSAATNETGFSALPGGTRYSNGIFFSAGSSGYWWTSTKSGSLNGWYRSMNSSSSSVKRNYDESTNGFSVRCVKN